MLDYINKRSHLNSFHSQKQPKIELIRLHCPPLDIHNFNFITPTNIDQRIVPILHMKGDMANAMKFLSP